MVSDGRISTLTAAKATSLSVPSLVAVVTATINGRKQKTALGMAIKMAYASPLGSIQPRTVSGISSDLRMPAPAMAGTSGWKTATRKSTNTRPGWARFFVSPAWATSARLFAPTSRPGNRRSAP